MSHFNTNLVAISTLILIGFIGISCVNAKHDESDNVSKEATIVNSKKVDFPYNLEKPVQYNMPQNLFEISGIAFYKGDPKEIFAIQDEDGDLFSLGLGDKESKSTKFGGKGDYEDLTIINNFVLVLKSNGELHTFPFSENKQSEAEHVIKTKDLVPKAEYEGLAADEKNSMVYILTKDSKSDSKSKSSSIYGFKLAANGSLSANGEFSLSHKEIEKMSGSEKSKFRPSALAKNVKTNEWYILSSVNKLLVITDANFKVKTTLPLNSKLFNQPEGIAFDKNNNLYISNEGGNLSAGNILMFKLQ